MDSLQEAIIHPPELCEAHCIMDVRSLFDVFWTDEQKHPPTAMIMSQITYVTMVHRGNETLRRTPWGMPSAISSSESYV